MLFRNSYFSQVLAFFTAVIFFNMSLVMTEISALDLDSHEDSLLVNLVQLISGSGMEEEKDSTNESSTELTKDLGYFINSSSNSLYNRILTTNGLHTQYSSKKVPVVPHEIITPPPKELVFFMTA